MFDIPEILMAASYKVGIGDSICPGPHAIGLIYYNNNSVPPTHSDPPRPVGASRQETSRGLPIAFLCIAAFAFHSSLPFEY